MSQIKKFIDRVATAEGRQMREVLMPISEAKLLRDDIMKLMLEQKGQKKEEDVITVVVNGGKW